MNCKNCNTEIIDGHLFCGKCGTSTETSISPLPSNPPSPKRKLRIVIVALLCLVGIAVGIFLLALGNVFDGVRDFIISDPTADIITALEEGDHAEALMLASEIEDSEPLLRRLEDRLVFLETDFRSENIDFSVVSAELNTIERMNVFGLSSTLNRVSNTVGALNASRTSFNTAEEFFARGNYADAITHYSLVIQDDSNFETALTGISNATNAYRNQVLAEADQFASTADYEKAIGVLNNGLLVIANDSELMQSLTLNEQRFVSYIISNADRALEAGNHDLAIRYIIDALRTVPDNEQLLRKIDEIETARPVNLLSLDPVSSSNWSPNETRTQIVLRHASFMTGVERSQAEFFVDRNYSTLRGTISADETLDPNAGLKFLVFADDTLVYESDYINRASTFDFEANIAGAQFIQIRVTNQRREGSSRTAGGRFTASDLFLTQ